MNGRTVEKTFKLVVRPMCQRKCVVRTRMMEQNVYKLRPISNKKTKPDAAVRDVLG